MSPTTFKEAKKLFDATKKAADKRKNLQTIIAPPSLYIRELSKGYRGRVAFAVQNAFYELAGARTGEISFVQAKDAHVTYALVGHAERRALGETNEDTKLKVAAAVAAGIVPILCVGEEKRLASGEHFTFIREQLRSGFSGVPSFNSKKVMVAYEPVWAIGSTKPMTPRDMHEMSIFIRKTLVEFFGAGAMEVKTLYGGAIDVATAPVMVEQGDVHGLLVGRAGSEVEKVTALFAALV